MKPKHVISIVANLLLVTALSGCGVEASSVATASAATQQPPAMKQSAPTFDNEKAAAGDGSFKVYEYY
jgi:hypothetical protein